MCGVGEMLRLKKVQDRLYETDISEMLHFNLGKNTDVTLQGDYMFVRT